MPIVEFGPFDIDGDEEAIDIDVLTAMYGLEDEGEPANPVWIAQELGLSVDEVLDSLNRMEKDGLVRPL